MAKENAWPIFITKNEKIKFYLFIIMNKILNLIFYHINLLAYSILIFIVLNYHNSRSDITII